MANEYVTPSMIARETWRVLTQVLSGEKYEKLADPSTKPRYCHLAYFEAGKSIDAITRYAEAIAWKCKLQDSKRFVKLDPLPNSAVHADDRFSVRVCWERISPEATASSFPVGAMIVRLEVVLA